MGELVNLRRARKQQTRTEAAAQADANRAKHGISKREHDLIEARRAEAERDLSSSKLDEKS
ncbi:MAG: DUF4169 family protein [Alphaproteobacteria bacterium]|nr:DUF4169 family protein [Alphaproteobacteria bacterium]MBV9063186.1 DUF4169 family protein [Alphaproteobacteria bacterium]